MRKKIFPSCKNRRQKNSARYFVAWAASFARLMEIIETARAMRAFLVSGRFASSIHFKYSRWCATVHPSKNSLSLAFTRAALKSVGISDTGMFFRHGSCERYIFR